MDLALILQCLTAGGVLLGGVSMIWVAMEMTLIRSRISEVVGADEEGEKSTHGADPKLQGGYGIYIYKNGRWELESDLSAPGYEPSPPTLAGAFEGHVVRKESWPKAGH